MNPLLVGVALPRYEMKAHVGLRLRSAELVVSRQRCNRIWGRSLMMIYDYGSFPKQGDPNIDPQILQSIRYP